MKCEECRQELWKAGDTAPAGTYARVDDLSYRIIHLKQAGPLPATFDGRTALYALSACRCASQENKPAGAQLYNQGEVRTENHPGAKAGQLENNRRGGISL